MTLTSSVRSIFRRDGISSNTSNSHAVPMVHAIFGPWSTMNRASSTSDKKQWGARPSSVSIHFPYLCTSSRLSLHLFSPIFAPLLAYLCTSTLYFLFSVRMVGTFSLSSICCVSFPSSQHDARGWRMAVSSNEAAALFFALVCLSPWPTEGDQQRRAKHRLVAREWQDRRHWMQQPQAPSNFSPSTSKHHRQPPHSPDGRYLVGSLTLYSPPATAARTKGMPTTAG